MKNITLEELLEAGCHFGHQIARQNSKAREFIFEARDGIHIIDLEKTKQGLDEAAAFVKTVAQKGGTILVLSTKKQAQEIIRTERKRAEAAGAQGMYFVTQRWIGGTLTNFSEVAKNFKRLQDLKKKLQDEFERVKYTKKELGDFDKTRIKLEGFYGGIQDLTKLPDALLIVDTHMEEVAVQEAMIMGVPTVGLVDTNADPTVIDYPIPTNDDAKKSLELIIGHLFDAWIEGKKAEQSAKGTEKAKGEEQNVESKEKKAEGKEEIKVTKEAAGEQKEKEEKKVKNEEKKTIKKEKKTSK